MKKKKVNFELIEDLESEPYRVLAAMRKFHEDVEGAAVALAWRQRLKTDKDGHLVLGKCVKVSDLYREFAAYDFVIVLNREMWWEFSAEQKSALVDHELSHCAVAEDDDGAPVYDERNRRVFRVRKHDIEEFTGIVKRHGCYKRDLEIFAQAIIKRSSAPLFDAAPTPRLDEPGVVEMIRKAYEAAAEPVNSAPLAQAAVMGGTHQRKQRKPRDAKREAAADGSGDDEPNIVD